MVLLSTGGIALKFCAANKTMCAAAATAFPAHSDPTTEAISRLPDYIDDKYPFMQNTQEMWDIAHKYITQMRAALVLAGHDLYASQDALQHVTSSHMDVTAAVSAGHSGSTAPSSMGGMWAWAAPAWAEDALAWARKQGCGCRRNVSTGVSDKKNADAKSEPFDFFVGRECEQQQSQSQ